MTRAQSPFVGEIRAFGFNFAPNGWALCNGQLMAISQNTALFSLLGTTYGGDGKSTFALPDLRGRAPIHRGQGTGLSNRNQGETGGSEIVTLLESQLPSHTHQVAASTLVKTKNPGGSVHASGGAYGTTPNTAMHPGMVQPAGGGQPHENMSPFLTVNWCIALQGIFPPRNGPSS